MQTTDLNELVRQLLEGETIDDSSVIDQQSMQRLDHMPEALAYEELLRRNPSAIVVEKSSKRTADMPDGRMICFSKERTAFHQILCTARTVETDINGHKYVSQASRPGFRPLVLALPLSLDDFNREFVLAVWRDGKAKWMAEHGIESREDLHAFKTTTGNR